MPWSPIPKFPEIIRNLKSTGKIRVSPEELTTEIMRATNLFQERSIKPTIQAMERLGFIIQDGICWNLYPEKMKAKEEEDIEGEADELLGAVTGAKA